jgi:hypothetical protein
VDAGDDLIKKSNAVTDLKEALDRCWQARAAREVQVGDLVAHLQGILLDVPAENLAKEHLEAIGRVLGKASAIPALTDSDLRDFEEILMKAGCDVFRELR